MTTISNIDLHCHTNASDGGFTPREVVLRAYGRGLNVLAITDHDLVAGVQEAVDAAAHYNALLREGSSEAPVETYIKPTAEIVKVENGILNREPQDRQLTVIPGIELSTGWRDEQIHIAGLFVDIYNEDLLKLVATRRSSRMERALAISEKLDRVGIHNAYERCAAKAQAGASITRGNYARLIYEDGLADSIDEAFHKYLRRGQPAYVQTEWGPISEAVEAINAAGGIAVLAHPRRYNISNQRLRKLIYEFKECGGGAMEVSNSQQSPLDRDYLMSLCVKYELYASLGSDFHNEGIYRDLGQNLDLDPSLPAVWTAPQAERFMSKDFKQRLVHLTYRKEYEEEEAEEAQKAVKHEEDHEREQE